MKTACQNPMKLIPFFLLKNPAQQQPTKKRKVYFRTKPFNNFTYRIHEFILIFLMFTILKQKKKLKDSI